VRTELQLINIIICDNIWLNSPYNEKWFTHNLYVKLKDRKLSLSRKKLPHRVVAL